jgi:hypothetical protein
MGLGFEIRFLTLGGTYKDYKITTAKQALLPIVEN